MTRWSVSEGVEQVLTVFTSTVSVLLLVLLYVMYYKR